MEYRNPANTASTKSPADIAVSIFKKGMERFGNEVEYVFSYLEFLISINDEKSMHLVTPGMLSTNPICRCSSSVR
jgi:hypothetical protein